MWVLLLFPILLVNADIFSCGGFVKSDAPLDYSKIKVRLLSPEGHLKHEEDCNPQNGYYMIPVYKKGTYLLKVQAPEGYYFEPSTIDFLIDGTNDPCSKNEDLNFRLTSFAINGMVTSKSGGGPAGLHLTLQQDGKIVDRTITGEGGKYSFKAPSGKYEIVTDSRTTACISKGSVSVNVVSAPVTVSPNLQISGYRASVDVKVNSLPLKDAKLVLFSDDNLESLNCKKNPTLDEISMKFICEAGNTDMNGHLDFGCTPIGHYVVKPVFETSSMSLRFRPATKKFEVLDDEIKTAFDVSGFTVRGRVVRGLDGVSGASITVDGAKIAQTDEHGYYTLTRSTEGPIVISADKPQTKFSIVKTVLKLPNVSVPDISVVGFEICGSVEKSPGSQTYESLIFTKGEGSDSFTVQPTSDGKFCKMASLSSYTVTSSHSSSTLTPKSIEIDNLAGPLNQLKFTHFKTDVDASVTCIGTCGQLIVSLISGRQVVQTVNGADVTFRDVAPGTYLVRVSDEDGRCWEQNELSLMVDRGRPSPVHFVQSGFAVKFIFSHSATLYWNHAEKKQLKGEMLVKAGEAAVCVPVQGKYSARVKSCRAFSPDSVDFNVPTASPIDFKAVDAEIKGKVSSQEKGSFSVEIRSSSGNRVIPVVNGVFSFRETLATTGSIVLVPQSETFLFEPKSISLVFNGDCIENVGIFTADKGIFVEGSIEPAVSGVNIVATHSEDSNVKFEVSSDANGKFKVGPVRKVTDVSFSASLDGYEFKPNPKIPANFHSVKLSKLSVTLVDTDSENRLNGVLLSVVGGKEFRSNSIVGADGETNFVGLAPGDYYLRPILQEYKFVPSTTTIEVKEGEHEHVTLKGKRVAFSAIGKVREMSRKPVAGVIVEALSEKCDHHQSEAVTSQDGIFIIKGLLPGCSYRISTKSGPNGSSPPHCFPSFFDVQMTSEDVKELEMIATIQKQQTEIIVEMDFASMPVPSSYRVSVVRRTGESVATSIVNGPVTAYYLKGLERDGAEYSVRVEPDKPAMSFNAKTVFFTADAPVRVVRVPMTSSKKSGDVEITLGSFLALPFFGLILLAFFNQQKTIELSESLIGYVRNSSSDKTKKKQR